MRALVFCIVLVPAIAFAGIFNCRWSEGDPGPNLVQGKIDQYGKVSEVQVYSLNLLFGVSRSEKKAISSSKVSRKFHLIFSDNGSAPIVYTLKAKSMPSSTDPSAKDFYDGTITYLMPAGNKIKFKLSCFVSTENYYDISKEITDEGNILVSQP